MFQYVVRRLVYGLITLLALSIITFTLLQNTGGDPLDRLKSNPRITQEAVQDMAEFYGLDQSAPKQYLTWAGNFVQFWNYPTAWGRSFQGPQQVQEMVINRLGGTARLMFTALFLAVMIGIPLGIYQAIRQYSFFDQATTTFSFITFSTPIFVLGLGLQIIFALKLEQWTGVKFFYTSGMNSTSYADFSLLQRVGDTAQHLVLPAISIALISIAGYSRYQRASMLEVLHSDYLRTAKAKGLSRRTVIVKHVLRNALLPTVTVIAISFGWLISGLIVIENVFFLPGLGRLIFQAIAARDLIVVESVVMLLVFAVILVNFLVDLGYAAVDPRLRRR